MSSPGDERKRPPGAVVGHHGTSMPAGAVAQGPAGAAAALRVEPPAPASGAEPEAERNRPYHFSQVAHRQVIGYLGLLLPLMLLGLAAIRETTGLPRNQILPSVSAYYYTGAVAAFVGILFALSLFLFTYRGYEGARADRVVGFIGGLAALGVAFFPTKEPDGVERLSWWSQTTSTVHHVSAIVLFASFIVFSTWLFRKTDVPAGEPLPPDKRWRNRIFLACGVVMTGAVLWAAVAQWRNRPIFLPEVIALIAFAISWLVKGEAHESLASMVKGR